MEQSDPSTAEEAPTTAKEWLLTIKSRSHISLTPLEQSKFHEFFALHRHCPVFKRYHIAAIRKCLQRRDYRLARTLLDEDNACNLLESENDMLQVAIKAYLLVEPFKRFGEGMEEICPGLLPMVELLIDHGVSANCLDNDGDSALYYACFLGYAKLVDFLVAAGANLSTKHRRWIPYELGKSGDALEQSCPCQEQYGEAHLLQITLDALIASKNYTGEIWLGYDLWLWKVDLRKSWCGIALRLLQEGHSYTKDDPALIMILHIACFQGSLGFVEQLLDFGIDTSLAGPRVVYGDGYECKLFGTALHAAAALSQLSVVKLLVEHGGSLRTRRLCIFRIEMKPRDMTPVEIAVAWTKYMSNSNEEELFIFLGWLAHRSESLEESDYQEMVEICVIQNRIDLAKTLLERGVQPQEELSNSICSLEMAQLLVSYGAVLMPSEVQTNALKKPLPDLLQWCVDKYGPWLSSDPESWGEMAHNLIVRSGYEGVLETMEYLVSEYPGTDINAVLNTLLPPHSREAELTPTNWLHLALLERSLGAIRLLLKHGADPSFPGLAFDAATAVRQDRRLQHLQFRDTQAWMEIINILEGGHDTDEAKPLPSYTELKARQIDTIAKQGCLWDRRVKEFVDRRIEVPFKHSRTNPAPTSRSNSIGTADTRLKYLPLRGKSSFRLLEVLPAPSRTAPLRIRLIYSDLTFREEYEALSYVWGDANPEKFVYEDENAISVAPNLHSALIRLRLSNHIRTLWVDALCIDQSSSVERSQQIMIMGDIYLYARQVMVWLGEAADDSNLVFACLNEDLGADEGATGGPGLRHAWYSLITRPWFFRTWVIQEVVLNREAVFVCGEDSVPWRTLVSRRWRGHESGTQYLDYGDDFEDIEDEDEHPIAGFHAENHINRLRGLEAGKDPIDIMQYSRVCQTSDGKDRIYGILGLFEPGFITVDYEFSVEQVFRQFTEAVLRRTGNLRILRYFGVGPESISLPSWVPDYTDTTMVQSLYNKQRGHFDDEPYTYRTADGGQSSVSQFDLTRKVLPGLAFQDNGALVIKGKRVDTIRALGPELPAGTTCVPGTEAFSQAMQAWESLAATLVSKWEECERGRSVTQAFATTMTANPGALSADREIAFAEWYRHCGTGILEAADPAMSLRDTEFYMWWTGYGQSNSDKLGMHLEMFAKNMELACYGRRFFTTEGGSMGLTGPRARVGDDIVFLPGTDMPFVLRLRHDRAGWTMGNDCHLYGLDLYELFLDEELLVSEFIIL